MSNFVFENSKYKFTAYNTAMANCCAHLFFILRYISVFHKPWRLQYAYAAIGLSFSTEKTASGASSGARYLS